MTTEYEPKWRFGILVLAIPAVSWVFVVVLDDSDAIPILLLIAQALVWSLLATWVWFGTGYRLDEEFLVCRSGPLRGKIPIESITEVNPHVRALAGVRPALSFQQLRVRYNRFDDVFIAPKDEETFIEDLREKRPEIALRQSCVY